MWVYASAERVYMHLMLALTDLLRPTRRCTCAALRRASRSVTRHFEEEFRGAPIRATQFTVLSMAQQLGPQSMTALADRLGLERTTLNRTVQPLIAKGLVASSGGDDARVRVVEVTKAGEAMLRKTFPRWQKAQAGVASTLKALAGEISTEGLHV